LSVFFFLDCCLAWCERVLFPTPPSVCESSRNLPYHVLRSDATTLPRPFLPRIFFFTPHPSGGAPHTSRNSPDYWFAFFFYVFACFFCPPLPFFIFFPAQGGRGTSSLFVDCGAPLALYRAERTFVPVVLVRPLHVHVLLFYPFAVVSFMVRRITLVLRSFKTCSPGVLA